MKALALALVSIPAMAQMPEIIGIIPNRDDNKITFTSVRGSCEEGQLMSYAQYSGGKIGMVGCYQVIGDQVFVKWADGDLYTYDFNSLILTEEFKQYIKKQK